jgi:O-antigen ligase
MLWGGLILIGLVLGVLRSARVAVAGLALSIAIVVGLSVINGSVREQIMSLRNVKTISNLGEHGRRKQFWIKAIRVWQDAPWLGIGPKTFSIYDDIKHNPDRKKLASLSLPGSAHNLYLQTAAEMGAVGLLALVATFAYIGVWLFRSRGAFASAWPAAAWDGAFGSWLAIVIHGLTYPSFGREHAMFFFMLLGLVQARLLMEKKSVVVAEGQKA